MEPFREQDMISLDQLAMLAEAGKIDSCLLPVDAGLSGWPLVVIDESLTHRFCHGNPVPTDCGETGLVRVYGPENQLLGLGEITPENQLKPKRLMHLDPQ